MFPVIMLYVQNTFKISATSMLVNNRSVGENTIKSKPKVSDSPGRWPQGSSACAVSGAPAEISACKSVGPTAGEAALV